MESTFPRMIRDYTGWLAITTLALGRETGMLGVVLEGPVTVATLVNRARVDERSAAAWLAAMTAHGYLTHADGVFTMREEDAAAFVGFPFDLGAILDFTRRCAGILPDVEEAIRKGGGVAPAVYHRHLGDCVGRIPNRLYEMALDGWLEQAGLGAALADGASVLELAPGSGAGLMHLAERHPGARFKGIDLDRASVQRANAEAARRGLQNVRFEVGDVSALEGEGVHDLVFVLDALHHFAAPSTVLRKAGRTLKPGGRIAVIEMTATGDLAKDLATPFAPILTTSALLYCMQEGLHGGGVGLGTTFGTDNYRKLVTESGFGGVAHVDTDAGYTVVTGVR
jgi:2-polyprenyl-3-methyl-5-hydroxy-6-metoxy-1,4-benzoquinol methylase